MKREANHVVVMEIANRISDVLKAEFPKATRKEVLFALMWHPSDMARRGGYSASWFAELAGELFEAAAGAEE